MADGHMRATAQERLWRRESGAALGFATLHARIVGVIGEGVATLKGQPARETIARAGLEALHTVVDARDISALRDHVLDALRPDLLRMAVAVGRDALCWGDEFYVDDYLILRINFPFEVAKNADPAAENPGIGRVSAEVREIARARRLTDPVYDPKSYHAGYPPAAWAHGPHCDSWAGHSSGGVNIWWAMCDVPAEASMVLYPSLAEETLPPDPRTLYLSNGYRLPVPTLLPLAAGDMLVFDPEILHGTHLNVTSQTRVAVSLRLNAAKPTFDPGCFYAREFWRRASDIEAGLDAVLHLKREENLLTGPTRPAINWPAPLRTIVAREGDAIAVRLGEGERLAVQFPARKVLLQRLDGILHAVDAACPHYGRDLTDGGCEGRTLRCPGCGVGFDVTTGASPTASLMLRRFNVSESPDGVHVSA